MSKNEVGRDDKYNRRLFLRIKRGHYIVNPELSLRVDDEWQNIYDLLQVDMVSFTYTQPTRSYYSDTNEHFASQILAFKNYLQTLR
ncbi:MAG: hypothetical protein GKR94_00660 [Gammaproteobacteria bacterium]|nr:hypothetical protein [Gammaproteobacteria bacterium]